MNCLVFVSNGLEGTPIAELGGLVLQKDKAIIVIERIGNDMKTHYGNKLVHVASIEKEKLGNGKFELANPNDFKVSNSEVENKEDFVGENKSMANRRKVKSK